MISICFILLLLISILTSSYGQVTCASGWVQYGGSCYSCQISTLVINLVLGISAILIVLHLIRVQQCFVSIIMLKISLLEIVFNMDIICGLDILTCYHMEEGKVPSSMAGSQDALLPIPIGGHNHQTITVTMKIMH